MKKTSTTEGKSQKPDAINRDSANPQLQHFTALLMRLNGIQAEFIAKVLENNEVPADLREKAYNLQTEALMTTQSFNEFADKNIKPITVDQDLLCSLTLAASIMHIVGSGMDNMQPVDPGEVSLVDQVHICLKRLEKLGIKPVAAAKDMAVEVSKNWGGS